MSMRPRMYDRSKLDTLRTEVPNRTFRRYDEPNGLDEIIDEAGPARLRCTVVASSFFDSQQDHPLGKMAPCGEVILVRRYRYCEHDGSPHFNADNQLLWSDATGRAWQATPANAPDHYIAVISGTALEEIAEAYLLPEQKQGSIELFREDGARLDFGPVCPGGPVP